MDRNALINDFLKKNHLDKVHLDWLPSDASFRHYARIFAGQKSYILMDAPPPENPHQFAVIDRILCENDLSAPVIYASDFENGLLLLEDFGSDSYAKMLQSGFDELTLYKTALASLLQLEKVRDFKGVPLYDQAWIDYGLSAFTDWFIPCALDRELTEDERKDFYQIWIDLFNSITNAHKGLILIDYHIDNMMYLKDRTGHRTCGLLDFQDARVGPLAYDLASLIEDARRDVPVQIKDEILQLYLSAHPDWDKDLFMRSYHIVAVKRHLRVIGVFTRLKARDGKDKYLQHIARVWRLLESHLDLPYMQPLQQWLDKVVSKDLRKAPQCLLNQK